ncbi:NAD(P)/FAD-dependent oxidoreductase [Anabaena sp. PCC 7108]|uniref:dihydrolipoyl dehydrogenase family protein n=1 Tax=Anabaena sp. PCC 7108 TaxID=163908 RepID=UPI000347CE58|nr:NAD(P)/FAD-dependent oxidoreductase [Anabaena sp. PCC 7108]
MKIDYDIVIIGGSVAGYQAALAATQLQATVALVQPQVNYDLNYQYVLSELSKRVQQSFDLANLGIFDPQVNSPTVGLPAKSPPAMSNFGSFKGVKEAILYARSVAKNLSHINSLANLAAQGVDMIFDSGQFQSSPQLGFAVKDRILRGRTYLLACGSRPAIPEIEGLQATGYLTLANIWQSLDQSNPPKNWVIIGGLPQSIEIAQILARLGSNVILIVKNHHILSDIDPEIAQLLLAQLEVDGIRVITQTIVTQVLRIKDKKWVQAGDKAIETDEILVATRQQPNIESLNLAAAGVKFYPHRLVVNKKLQTTNHRIYACGDVIGGYDIVNIANYEANIALKNALFLPQLAVNYRSIPWGISSQPILTQVGLTEIQAQRQYGKNKVLVFKQYFKTVAAAQIRGEITGICKLIIRENGEIVGCSILGTEAIELINVISLAISQNIQVKHLANLASVYPSFSEIFVEIAKEWDRERLHKNHTLQEFLQSFFHFRRNWNL